jgi:SAM-dependent methyltransferase
MNSTEPFLDFGHGHWFDHLDSSRRFMWSTADLPRLASLLELRPGMRIADFGCGWGFLGHLLLPLISPGGRVDGFELQDELIQRGRERITEAGQSGRIVIHQADITNLDEVQDDRYSLAICQTVLMHLNRPDKALAEMSRVVKPGGLVVAIEPDLLAASASRRDNLDGEDFDHLRTRLLVDTYAMQGCRKSGAGDYRIAAKLPSLMNQAGLLESRLWFNPMSYQCSPPYSEHGDDYASYLIEHYESGAAKEFESTWKMLFEAGGGPTDLWQRYEERESVLAEERLTTLRKGTYRVAGSGLLGVCTARVPV